MREFLLRHSEHWADWLAYLPPSLRIGRGYSAMSREIASFFRRQAADRELVTFRRLQRLLSHAYEKVPFYAELYRRHGFHPREFRSMGDWVRVPVVTKEDLRGTDLRMRCANGVTGRPTNTGGTSGAPLSFHLEKGSAPVEWAHMHSIWFARGYRMCHTKLRLGGAYFPGSDAVRFHPRHNEYIANANADIQAVVDAALSVSADRPIRWIHGYPSLVAEFAQALAMRSTKELQVLQANIFGVLLGSEYPAPHYREPIQKVISSNVVSWYGHSEMAVLARETAEGIYHSLPTYGYAEAVSDGDAAEARLVCTSLHNNVHPFIRYDTGDLVLPLAASGGSLSFRISEGRVGDFVVDRRGRRLALTSIIFGRHHQAFDRVCHLQVRQSAPGSMTLLVVPRANAGDAAEFRNGFDFTGLDLDWDLEFHQQPQRTPAGKIRLKVDY